MAEGVFDGYCQLSVESDDINTTHSRLTKTNHTQLPRSEYCGEKRHMKSDSRWVKVIVIGLALTLTSCLYSGWQAFSVALIDSGKYEWLCDSHRSPTTNQSTINDHPQPLGHRRFPISFSHSRLFGSARIQCDAQRQAIDQLFAIAAAWEFFGGIIGGILLDLIGPKRTALIGEITGLISLLMISTVPSPFQHSFRVAFVHLDLLKISFALTGAAVNIISYPGLVLEDYFNDTAAQCAAFNVACQTLSAAVAPITSVIIMNLLPNLSLINGWFCYAIVVWIPAGLAYVLILPSERPKLRRENIFELEDGNKSNSLPSTSKVHESNVPLVSTEERSFNIVSFEPLPFEDVQPTCGQRCAEKAKEILLCLNQACHTSEFISLLLINGILTIQGAFYQMECRDVFGDSLSTYLGWIIPLQSIFTLLLARAARTLKSAKMAIGILIGFAINYLIAAMGIANITQYINASLFVVNLSYSYNIKYTYVEENYSVDHYGTLLGFTSLTGGFFVLVTQVFVETLHPRIWFFALALMSGAVLPLTIRIDLKSRALRIAAARSKNM